MRKFFILVAMIVALASNATPPHFALDSAYVDIGRIEPDSIAETTMRFRNTGGDDLEILQIYSECGCTVPSYPSDPVPPGDSGEIRIRFNSRGRLAGAFRKTLRIRTNADNPREMLLVKGVIK